MKSDGLAIYFKKLIVKQIRTHEKHLTTDLGSKVVVPHDGHELGEAHSMKDVVEEGHVLGHRLGHTPRHRC